MLRLLFMSILITNCAIANNQITVIKRAISPQDTFSLKAFLNQPDEDIQRKVAKRDFPPGLGETVKKFSKKLEQLSIYDNKWCRCSGNNDATMCLITCVSCDLHCPKSNPQCLKQCLTCAPRCHGSQACLNSCLCNKKCSGDASCESACLSTGAFPFRKKGPSENDGPGNEGGSGGKVIPRNGGRPGNGGGSGGKMIPRSGLGPGNRGGIGGMGIPGSGDGSGNRGGSLGKVIPHQIQMKNPVGQTLIEVKSTGDVKIVQSSGGVGGKSSSPGTPPMSGPGENDDSHRGGKKATNSNKNKYCTLYPVSCFGK